jgi:hypothetical protein
MHHCRRIERQDPHQVRIHQPVEEEDEDVEAGDDPDQIRDGQVAETPFGAVEQIHGRVGAQTLDSSVIIATGESFPAVAD